MLRALQYVRTNGEVFGPLHGGGRRRQPAGMVRVVGEEAVRLVQLTRPDGSTIHINPEQVVAVRAHTDGVDHPNAPVGGRHDLRLVRHPTDRGSGVCSDVPRERV